MKSGILPLGTFFACFLVFVKIFTMKLRLTSPFLPEAAQLITTPEIELVNSDSTYEFRLILSEPDIPISSAEKAAVITLLLKQSRLFKTFVIDLEMTSTSYDDSSKFLDALQKQA
jgi:hypothetical protein